MTVRAPRHESRYSSATDQISRDRVWILALERLGVAVEDFESTCGRARKGGPTGLESTKREQGAAPSPTARWRNPQLAMGCEPVPMAGSPGNGRGSKV